MRLGQLLDNLLSNAVKFTPGGGTVSVTVATRGPFAHLEVADTGVGIPADELDNLFESLLSCLDGRTIAGTGLGLSIAKSIAEAHGGTIAVMSEVGAGTTFIVDLPSRSDSGPPVKTSPPTEVCRMNEPAQSPPAVNREQPLVLAADDDEDILELITFRLERSGYTVVQAHDGEEAWNLAQTEQPDLAVLDVMMPKLDGFELTRRLRADEATSRMPIILLTARAQDADVQEGFDAGADDYIRKPFSPQELRARVQAILGRR